MGPYSTSGVSNLQPMSRMWLRMAMNVVRHKTGNLLKTFFFLVITFCNIFNVWPKTTLLLQVWSQNAQRLDTPALQTVLQLALFIQQYIYFPMSTNTIHSHTIISLAEYPKIWLYFFLSFFNHIMLDFCFSVSCYNPGMTT